MHTTHDEIFYVVSGEFLIQLGDDVHLAKPGDTAFVPRGTKHTYAHPYENNPGLIISIYQSAPKMAEKFFEYVGLHGKMPEHLQDPESPTVGPPIDVDAALAKAKKG